MAVEVVFRLQEDGEDYLFWMSIHGAAAGGLDPDNALDRDHVEQAKHTIPPSGRVEAEPQVLLKPEPVREAVLGWALRDDQR